MAAFLAPNVFGSVSTDLNQRLAQTDVLKEPLQTQRVQGAAFSPGRRTLVFRVLRRS